MAVCLSVSCIKQAIMERLCDLAVQSNNSVVTSTQTSASLDKQQRWLEFMALQRNSKNMMVDSCEDKMHDGVAPWLMSACWTNELIIDKTSSTVTPKDFDDNDDEFDRTHSQARLIRTMSITSASASKGDLADQHSVQSAITVVGRSSANWQGVQHGQNQSRQSQADEASLRFDLVVLPHQWAKMKFSQVDTKKTVLQRKFETDMAEAEMLDAAERAARERDDSQYELLSPGSLLDIGARASS
eukprot:gene26805-33444_t